MGSSSFAVPILETLHQKGFFIDRVFTRPDAPKGRGRSLQCSPIKYCTKRLNLTCSEPISLKSSEAKAFFEEASFDVVIVVSYGLLIPEDILNLPRYGFVNIHPSLLPKYRGAAPIQTVLSDGQPYTGVSVMNMTKTMDAGPVYLQKKEPILEDDSYESLEKRLIQISIELLLDFLYPLKKGELLPFLEQDHKKATYTKPLTSSFAIID